MAYNKNDMITIKKYANRRLYNTATSTYVTLENLAEMIKQGVVFNVYDAKTGEDITRSVLTQIIVEAENNGKSLLPISFMRQLIGFYGGNVENMLGNYLENAMQTFTGNQEKVRETMQSMTGGLFPLPALEDISKQNIAALERTVNMFTPLAKGDVQEASRRMRTESEKSLEDMKNQINALQKQLAEMMTGNSRKG